MNLLFKMIIYIVLYAVFVVNCSTPKKKLREKEIF
jgi:hypothetical protein